MGGNGPSTQCPVTASEISAVLQIKEVLRLTPRKRQTLLFSATMTEEVRDLAALSLQRPVRLAADAAGAAPETLQQEIVRLKVPSCMVTSSKSVLATGCCLPAAPCAPGGRLGQRCSAVTAQKIMSPKCILLRGYQPRVHRQHLKHCKPVVCVCVERPWH